MSDANTFSESWYRVADQKIALRPHVSASRQYFRGEKWYVLRDPYNNAFFRLRPQAYDFLARLRPERTVREAWEECLESNPEGAPGQQEVIELLAQLYHANLLHYPLAADSRQLLERYKKRRTQEVQSKFVGVMFSRFPLLDPDKFLLKTMPLVGWLISPVGAVLWLLVIGFALKLSIDNAGLLFSESEGILAPANIPLLYLGMVIAKVLHEFGHAYFCRKFGGEVHVMGIMLLIFTPIPFVDATACWSFRNRWKRMLTGAAGMIVELFLAAIALMVWMRTGPGVVHSLAYNIMFIASVSTVLFNINPLLRFDGYYIMSDLLDLPNLHTRSKLQLKHLVEYYLFGCKRSKGQANTNNEAWLLAVFGVLAGIYRVFVFAMILVFISDKLLFVGLFMAVVCIVSWVFVPLFKLINYLSTSPVLERTRTRATAVVVGFVAVLFTVLYLVPFPQHFRGPGVVQAEKRAAVVNDFPGMVVKVLAQPGKHVEADTPLIELANPELEIEIRSVEAERRHALALERKALREETANLEPLREHLSSIDEKIAYLKAKHASLIVRAPVAGTWVSPDTEDLTGFYLPRGSSLGEVIALEDYYFSAIVSQTDAAKLFQGTNPPSEIRLRGRAEQLLKPGPLKIIPVEKGRLPSAALGWLAGGLIAVDPSDPEGRMAVEPFYEVRAPFIDSALVLYHGQSGRIRFDLPPEALLKQWGRKGRQMIQRRYQF